MGSARLTARHVGSGVFSLHFGQQEILVNDPAAAAKVKEITKRRVVVASRGVGGGQGTCLVCGQHTMGGELSMFVYDKEEGELAVEIIGQGAWLDFRPHEPNWVQIKVNCCPKHIKSLELFDGHLRREHELSEGTAQWLEYERKSPTL